MLEDALDGFVCAAGGDGHREFAVAFADDLHDLRNLLGIADQLHVLGLLLVCHRLGINLDALFLGKHPQHFERRDAAERVKTILRKHEAVPGCSGTPSRIVDRHGVDDRSVTVEYQSFRLHKKCRLLERGQALLEVVGEEC